MKVVEEKIEIKKLLPEGQEYGDRVVKNTKDVCYCPDCGLRRVLWPLHQNVSSWSDPKVQWIHINGLKDCE